MLGRLSLENKVAIITGAAGGLGSATARLMAQRGARLVIADLDLARAEALAGELPGALAAAVDLGDEVAIQRLIKQTVSHYGRLDILHNNAADLSPETAGRDHDIATMLTEVWDRTFRVNVRGTMIACREALPHMLKQGGGSIINMVSSLALQGHIVQNAYSSSKSAVIQLTRCIAAAYGPQGVRCNSLAPGLTLTPQVAKVFPEVVRHLVEKETLRDRLGEPEDLAESVAWLASDAAINMNGQLIVCDGGCTTHVPDIAGYRALGAASAPN
ncbi:MAG: SDR family oxidoreductase [Asticcacaulis sp.]|uniref:SDR family NAD(P)-dependent oxidoreductase n=1 Tax=Asticcacaulis sp. TaxID=1872648 RepID=UPI0039E5CA4D